MDKGRSKCAIVSSPAYRTPVCGIVDRVNRQFGASSIGDGELIGRENNSQRLKLGSDILPNSECSECAGTGPF